MRNIIMLLMMCHYSVALLFVLHSYFHYENVHNLNNYQ